MPAEADAVERRRRKLWVYANHVGLTDEERHDLTEVLLHTDTPSWSGMEDADVCRLLDAFEGFILIGELIAQRGGS